MCIERGSVIAHQERHARKDPDLVIEVFTLHLQMSREHVSGSTHASHIGRTFIEPSLYHVFDLDGTHLHYRKSRVEFFKLLLCQVALVISTTHFPSCTFQEESMKVLSYGSGAR